MRLARPVIRNSRHGSEQSTSGLVLGRDAAKGGHLMLRGLAFATGILLGLVFAVACYAAMLGIVQFE